MVNVGCIQFSPHLGDLSATLDTLSVLISKAQNADLLVLPEFTGSMKTFWIFIACMAIMMALIFMFRRNDFIKRQNSE